jgi:hypothetical protein
MHVEIILVRDFLCHPCKPSATQIGPKTELTESPQVARFVKCLVHQFHGRRKKQDVVAISTTESENYALAETIKEVNWLRELLTDFNILVQLPISVFMDSQSCIKMVTNEKFSNRTKHIAVRFQFAKDHVHRGDVELSYVPTEDNIADMMTKPLAGTKIKYLRELALLQDKCP